MNPSERLLIADYDLTYTEEYQEDPLFDKHLAELQKKYPAMKKGSDYWIDVGRFCQDTGITPGTAYLVHMLENIGPGKPMGLVTLDELRQAGAAVKLSPGQPEFFSELESACEGIHIGHHLISAGIHSMMVDSPIVQAKDAGGRSYVETLFAARFAQGNGYVDRLVMALEHEDKQTWVEYLTDSHKVDPMQVVTLGDGFSDRYMFIGNKGVNILVAPTSSAAEKALAKGDMAKYIDYATVRDYRPSSAGFQLIADQLKSPKKQDKPVYVF